MDEQNEKLKAVWAEATALIERLLAERDQLQQEVAGLREQLNTAPGRWNQERALREAAEQRVEVLETCLFDTAALIRRAFPGLNPVSYMGEHARRIDKLLSPAKGDGNG
jgi:chromosome segregation ATPase